MKRNPIPTDQDLCEICGKPYAETHEVFGGPNRQKSIKYGMQVRFCAEHHRGQNGPHVNHDVDLTLKKIWQERFEETLMEQGLNQSEARGVFMREFGRNFLDD